MKKWVLTFDASLLSVSSQFFFATKLMNTFLQNSSSHNLVLTVFHCIMRVITLLDCRTENHCVREWGQCVRLYWERGESVDTWRRPCTLITTVERRLITESSGDQGWHCYSIVRETLNTLERKVWTLVFQCICLQRLFFLFIYDWN